ncbi:hypothetical protein [Iningainema tapete]|nr:hypothetical protein [Iningainema tapete]
MPRSLVPSLGSLVPSRRLGMHSVRLSLEINTLTRLEMKDAVGES